MRKILHALLCELLLLNKFKKKEKKCVWMAGISMDNG